MDAVRYVGEWILSTKRHSTTVSPDRQTVYSFDLEGRPISWYERGRVYKRSLASELFGRERKSGEKQYWQVSPPSLSMVPWRVAVVSSTEVAGSVVTSGKSGPTGSGDLVVCNWRTVTPKC